jgi:hypothetical protein
MDGLKLITLKSFGITAIKSKDVIINKEVDEKNYEVITSEFSIDGSYTIDLNLIELNDCILQLLDKQKKYQLVKYERVKREESYKVSKVQTKIDRINSLEQIRESDKYILSYSSDKPKKDYLSEVNVILVEYSKLGVLKKYYNFNKKKDDPSEPPDKKKHRLNLIEDFLNVAMRYANVNISRKDIFKGCMSCGYDISNFDDPDVTNYTCPNCFIEIDNFIANDNSPEINKKVVSTDGKVNFVKELNRFQGKSKNTKLPKNITELLDEYFTQNNFPIGSDIKTNSELNKKTSRTAMYKALKDIGLSKLYKDVNLVCNIYWGWPLINLDYLETKILEYYDTINEVFEKIKGDRSSSLNTQYELWWILTMIDYPCEAREFKMPKTPEIFNYHEKKRQEISEQLNWDFIPLSITSI